MQKYVDLIDLAKSFATSIYFQKSASIQPRTSPLKFGGNYSILFNRVLIQHAHQAQVRSIAGRNVAFADFTNEVAQ